MTQQTYYYFNKTFKYFALCLSQKRKIDCLICWQNLLYITFKSIETEFLKHIPYCKLITGYNFAWSF